MRAPANANRSTAQFDELIASSPFGSFKVELADRAHPAASAHDSRPRPRRQAVGQKSSPARAGSLPPPAMTRAQTYTTTTAAHIRAGRPRSLYGALLVRHVVRAHASGRAICARLGRARTVGASDGDGEEDGRRLKMEEPPCFCC